MTNSFKLVPLHIMRMLSAISLFLLQACFLAAEPIPVTKFVTCDYARYEAVASISEPLELEIPFSGEIFLAKGMLRIVAYNIVTREENWIIANSESSEIYLVYPDTLNGVAKALPEKSTIWKLLESGIGQIDLLNFPGESFKKLDAIKIGEIECTGIRFETESGDIIEIWSGIEGKPKRLVFQHRGNSAQFELFDFEHGVEVAADQFEIGDEFSIRKAAADEDLKPFQL